MGKLLTFFYMVDSCDNQLVHPATIPSNLETHYLYLASKPFDSATLSLNYWGSRKSL